MATIIEVARKANVSTATVSRVLSQPALVSLDTRQRVMKVVEELGYEPNPAARALRTLRASKLLVMVPDIANPFFGNIIRGAEEAARQNGYSLILGDTQDDPEIENDYAAMLRRRDVDGLIFLGSRLPESLGPALESADGRHPIVNGCEYSEGLSVSSVQIDNEGAGADGLEHFVSLGHRNIGIITGPLNSPISRNRLLGATNRAKSHGIDPLLRVRVGDYSVGSGFAEARDLIEEGVTAIFCFSDEMAIGAFRAVHDAGLACPDHVSVLGFDDIRFAQYLAPSLTTISQPSREIGRQTVELLLATISGEIKDPRVITLPHQLIVRESTAAVAVDQQP